MRDRKSATPDNTIGQYRRHCTALSTWLASRRVKRVAALTPDLLARFFSDPAATKSCRGPAKKAVSLNAMRASVRCFCAHLHDAGLVATNPARLLRRARCAPAPPRALHLDEQKRLLTVLANATGPQAERDRMLVELLLGSGLRLGSAISLDIEDLDDQHGEISVRRAKNDHPVSVVMSKAVAKALRQFVGKRTSGPLFRAGQGRLSVRHAQRRIAQWLAAASITGKSAHAFRHTFACEVYRRTGDLQLTQQALTHRAITSTVIYAQLDRARLRAAVGA